MYGTIGDQRFDMPITTFCEHVAERPADVGGTFAARITSIVHAGDAAGAVVVEENHLGTLSFVDFMTLCRSEGRWRIVNKTFAHTAGEMPQ
jgi:3-oxoacyl-[acyl-carrier-protein] synthase III